MASEYTVSELVDQADREGERNHVMLSAPPTAIAHHEGDGNGFDEVRAKHLRSQ